MKMLCAQILKDILGGDMDVSFIWCRIFDAHSTNASKHFRVQVSMVCISVRKDLQVDGRREVW